MADSHDDDGFVVLDQKATQDYNVAGLLPQSPQVLQKIVDWLEPTAYDDGSSEYARHLASHLRGTGDWLADTEEYRRWHGDDHRSHLLWIKAAPGTGKSVMAAHQRASLTSSEHAIVLHFFFRYIITTNRAPMQLIRDWIVQLLPFSPALQRQMKENYLDKQQTLQNVAFDDLWDEFRHACKTLPRVYCFVDALDEMDLNHDHFFVNLLWLEDVPACKVFVTSRPIPRIVEIFRNTSAICLTLGPENVSADISTYVDHRVERDMARYIEHRLDLNDSNLGDHETRVAVKPLIKSTLREKAQGSFLYSKLMLDSVLEAICNMNGNVSFDKARVVLDSLPSGLARMYDDMLRNYARRTGASLELQRNILRWVTHSERPLRLLELATVIQSAKDAQSPATDAKAVVRAACGPLLEIMPSDVVSPVHHSFTEFLTSASIPASGGMQNDSFVDSVSTHRFILEQCLTYLMHLDQNLPEEDPTVYDDRPQRSWLGKEVSATERWTDLKLKYPFFEYALSAWPSHARKSGRIAPAHLQLMNQFFNKTMKVSRIWIRSSSWAIDEHGSLYPRDGQSLWSSTVTPLHVAAVVGLPEYAESLVDSGQDVNIATAFDRTPLHYAASMGHTSVLEILLRAGADPHRIDVSQKCPLQYAAEAGHAECVDRLMAAGWGVKSSGNRIAVKFGLDQRQQSDPDRQLTVSITLAFQHQESNVINVFLEYLNAEEAAEIFYQSIGNTRLGIALAFISKPDFAVDEPIHGKTPIQLAVEYANLDCMRALLQRKARLNLPAESEDAGTLLHLFVSNATKRASTHPVVRTPDEELIEGIELLVQAGVPIEAVDKHSHTALYYARSGQALASALLRLGASPNSAISEDSSPLHKIAGDDEEGMKFWIQLGCDINARDAAGNTPLHLALKDYNPSKRSVEEKVITLLALGADPNTYSASGLTPLHMCHTRLHHGGNVTLLRTLLDGGADPNASDPNGITPLMTLALLPNKVKELAREVLIAAGSDPAARNILGETAFLMEIRLCARPDAAESSLRGISDIHTVNAEGSNAALVFCRYPSNVQRLENLAGAGFNFKLSDSFGNTALHKMALVERPNGQRGKIIEDDEFAAMLDRLLELGVETGWKNRFGQSSLHFAMIKGDEVMVDWLLQRLSSESELNDADIRGHTPLHIAACVSPSLVLSLINRGADPLCVTKTGQSALHLAAVARNTNVIALLLSCTEAKQKAFVNLADGFGRTALHYAARSGRHESVELLLDAGSDPNKRDHKERAPLNVCADFVEENLLWKRAHEVVQDYHESFIYSKDSDYNVKRLDDNVADFAAVAMTKQWEVMVRELSAAHPGASYGSRTRPSVRQCVRYLLSSGAEVIFPKTTYDHLKPGRDFGGQRFDAKSATIDALATGCDPLLDELLGVLEAEEEGLERLDRVIGETGRLQVAISRIKSRSLRELVHASHDRMSSHARYNLLMEEDRSDLAAALFLAICSAQKGPDLVEDGWFFEELIREGLSNDTASCVKELVLLSPTRPGPKSGCWPSSLQQLPSEQPSSNFGHRAKRQLDSGFVEDHDLFRTSLLDGSLLRACQYKESNHKVAVLLVEEGKISQQEKSYALAAMATAPHPWHLRTIEYLVQNGTDVNVQDPNGRTPLMRACHHGRADAGIKREVVKLLLRLGANVTLLDSKGQSCLDAAMGSLQTSRILIEHGGITGVSNVRRTLFSAVKSYNLEILRLLIDNGIDLEQMETQTDSCLFEGTEGSQNSDKGNGENAANTTSLLMEAYNGQCYVAPMNIGLAETVQFLLDRGADPFCPLLDGSLALHKLVEHGWNVDHILTHPSLDLERRDGMGRTLWLAASACLTDAYTRHEPSDTIKTLLDLGADVLATDRQGYNFLHHIFNGEGAAGMLDIIRAVLEKPATAGLLNAKNNDGYRPIQLALANRHFESAGVLVEFGADLTIVDPEGNTAFHHLLAPGFYSSSPDGRLSRLVNELISYQAMGANWEKQASLAPLGAGETRSIDINALNARGNPALFGLLRSIWMSPRLCCMLASKTDAVGTEVSPPGDQDDAAACTIQLLHKAGLRLDVKSSDGRGALHAFAAHRPLSRFYRQNDDDETMKEMWTRLVDAGLDPYAEDNEQRSALDIASACGNLCILELY